MDSAKKMPAIDTIRSVAFIASSAIGDTIMHTVPFSRWLKTVFPHATVTLITGDLIGNKLIEHCPYIDDKIIMKGGMSGKLKLIAKLMQKKYDIVFDLYPSDASAQLVKIMRKSYAICDASDSHAGAYNLPLTLPRETATKSILHKDLALLELLDPSYRPDYNFEVFTDTDSSLADKFFTDPGRKNMLIHLGWMERNMESWRNPRCLTVDRWLELLQKLRETFSLTIVFIGGKDNIEQVDQILTHFGHPDDMHSVAGASSIAQTLGLARQCDLMLCTDSGPMHFGMVYGKPIVGMRGKIAPNFDYFISHPIRKDDVMDVTISEVVQEVQTILS